MNDPRILKFTNGALRPVLDSLMSALLSAERLIELADAHFIESLLGASDPEEQIEDGSPIDGRNPLRVIDVLTTIQNLKALHKQVTTADTSGRSLATSADYIAVNPRSVI